MVFIMKYVHISCMGLGLLGARGVKFGRYQIDAPGRSNMKNQNLEMIRREAIMNEQCKTYTERLQGKIRLQYLQVSNMPPSHPTPLLI
jgi:hypothetical protein